MPHPALWISFYGQTGKIDQWALCLDNQVESQCYIWRASGNTFDFVADHIKGAQCETLPDIKDKLLLKADLNDEECDFIITTANKHTVDNEGEYWDCRIYCFEILGMLEQQEILSRDNNAYVEVRSRLHNKWKAEDGIGVAIPDGGHNSKDESSPPVTSKLVDHRSTNSTLHAPDTSDRTQSNSEALESVKNKKRTMSQGSGGTASSRDRTSTDGHGHAHDPRETKRQKDD